MTGILYGLGVGPGDPELITLKAYRLLQTVPVIAYPAPDHGDSLARRIAAPHLPGGQREIPIRMSLDPRNFPDHDAYDRAAAEIGAVLEQGEDVAMICEGDPLFHGSFIYLHDRLSQDRPVTVVPGITSLTACAAALNRPLVLRNEVLRVIPATRSEADLRGQLSDCEAAAIIKLGRAAGKILAILEDLDLTRHAAYVEHASMGSQRIRALSDLNPEEVPYFSMILLRKPGPSA